MKYNQKLLIGVGLGVLAIYLLTRRRQGQQSENVAETPAPPSGATNPIIPSASTRTAASTSIPQPVSTQNTPIGLTKERAALNDAILKKYGVSYGGKEGDIISTPFGTYKKTKVASKPPSKAFSMIWEKIS